MMSQWWKPRKYKAGTITCPLCGLPETGAYKRMCHCWDEQRASDHQNAADPPVRGESKENGESSEPGEGTLEFTVVRSGDES